MIVTQLTVAIGNIEIGQFCRKYNNGGMNIPAQKQQLEHQVCKTSLPVLQQRQKQQAVYRYMLRNSARMTGGNFSNISAEDLGMLFHAIDEHFFAGKVGAVCEKSAARPLTFRLSTRMTNSGGMTTCARHHGTSQQKPEYEIAIATTPLFETFKHEAVSHVGGLRCYDRLESLQRIMEHEMIHLIELLLWDNSSCSAQPFKQII